MYIEIGSPTLELSFAHMEIAPQRLGLSFVHTEIAPPRLGRSFLVATFLSPSPYGQSAGRLQGVGGRGEAKTVTPE